MALDQGQLLTLAGVLVILFLVIVFNNVQAARARIASRAGSSPGKSSAASSSAPVDPLLVKFARHDGSVVGETVALDGDRLILKQAGTFKAVPRAQAEVRGEDVVITGAVDWSQAAVDGAAWHASHRASAIPEVSGALTRSEDVKAPAMDSTRER
ncbi:MAG: DUF5749 family beta-barrel protein [Candidatus Thermoplasmatota archaeon]